MRIVTTIVVMSMVITLIGLGAKSMFFGEADAEVIAGSSGISPEQILLNHPDRNSFPIAEGGNAI
jgi:hypothetical protein